MDNKEASRVTEKEKLSKIYKMMKDKMFSEHIGSNFLGIKKYQILCHDKNNWHNCNKLDEAMSKFFSRFLEEYIIANNTFTISYYMFLLQNNQYIPDKAKEIKEELQTIEMIFGDKIKFTTKDIYKDIHENSD